MTSKVDAALANVIQWFFALLIIMFSLVVGIQIGMKIQPQMPYDHDLYEIPCWE